LKIVAILYPGGEAAKNNPGLLGCAENALGLRDFIESNGHELVVLTYCILTIFGSVLLKNLYLVYGILR